MYLGGNTEVSFVGSLVNDQFAYIVPMNLALSPLELFPILEKYGFRKDGYEIQALGSGLINATWKLTNDSGSWVLQRINTAVFTQPEAIAANIRLLGHFFKTHHPDYRFTGPVPTREGDEMVFWEGLGYFRLFPFVVGSRTVEVVNDPRLAYEAARAFGQFTRLLDGLDTRQLQMTLPGFHDLSLRYNQFLEALEKGDPVRIRDCQQEITQIKSFSFIVDRYKEIRASADFRLRVTHHDTKISNVLFDQNGQVLSVIDLDTVMPGYFISDLGDMVRTYVCPVSEEEADTSRVVVRKEYLAAVEEGYLSEMKAVMTPAEMDAVSYAGPFIIYMQALRFLTDHLNNDRYYGARYEGHNRVRAQNQLVLLEALVG